MRYEDRFRIYLQLLPWIIVIGLVILLIREMIY